MSAAPIPRTQVTPPSLHTEGWRVRLAAAPARTPAEVLDLEPGDGLVVAVAHPDDETLAMGSTLAWLVAQGIDVHVVAMSRGEAALDHLGLHLDGLAERRQAELAAATAALGATTTSMDLPDGRLGDHVVTMAEMVTDACARTGARRIATLFRDDPHPDHRAVSRAAALAGVASGHPVHEMALWTSHWTAPSAVTSDVVVLRTDERADRARYAALVCYPSQTEPLGPDLEPVLPLEVLEWTTEYVVCP